MIRSFRHRGLKRLFERGDQSKISPEHVEKIENVLAVLNRAPGPDDMDLPGFRLHPLKGAYRGFWAVTVPANWRIVFRFENGDAHDVNLIDYH
jgi:proteic killer suppression protein